MDPSKTESLLELEHIRLEMKGVAVLRNVSMRLERGRAVGVIGPNGAGKTSLFDVISGVRHPTGGRVLWCGEDITRWPPHRICWAGIGRTFQVSRPFPHMTAAENVMIGLRFGKRRMKAWRGGYGRAMELLEIVQLSHKARVPAGELTASELRRLELARALGTDPQLLLLDEIAAGLSPQAIAGWAAMIRGLRDQGLSILVVDHFLSLSAEVSDRLVVLSHGEKIAEGTPGEVLKSAEVLRAYLGGGATVEEGE